MAVALPPRTADVTMAVPEPEKEGTRGASVTPTRATLGAPW